MLEPIMNLDLPVVGETVSPDWANMFVTAFSDVAAHDHTTGNGVKITPSGLNIITDLTLQGNNLLAARAVNLVNNTNPLAEATDETCVFVSGGNLYYKNALQENVKITEGAALSLVSVKAIGGDFGGLRQDGSPVPADLTYSDALKSFTFLQEAGIGAELFAGKMSLAHPSAGTQAVTIETPIDTVAHTIVLPKAEPTIADSIMKFDTDGKAVYSPTGLLPLGSVIATFPNLTGAYNCTATTAADSYGFVVCGGQTIVDATSLMNSVVIPNINNSIFLMGHATSSSEAGSNTKDLTHNHTTDSQLGSIDLSHTHDISSHTHNLSNTGGALIGTDYQNIIQGCQGPSVDFYANNNTASLYVHDITPQSATTSFTSNTTGLVGRTDALTAAASTGAKSGAGAYSAAHSHSTNSTGLSSTFDIKPAYITARYLMRIK